MANRGAQGTPPSNSFALDSATEVFARASLADTNPASIRPHSFPIPTRGGTPTPTSSRRPKPSFKLSDINGGAAAAGLGAGRPNLGAPPNPRRPTSSGNNSNLGTPFANFGKIVDPSGALNFSGKAVLHASGVDFSGGPSFAINMQQLQLDEELGKGNYGTVKKVLHRPTNVAMAMKV